MPPIFICLKTSTPVACEHNNNSPHPSKLLPSPLTFPVRISESTYNYIIPHITKISSILHGYAVNPTFRIRVRPAPNNKYPTPIKCPRHQQVPPTSITTQILHSINLSNGLTTPLPPRFSTWV